MLSRNSASSFNWKYLIMFLSGSSFPERAFLRSIKLPWDPDCLTRFFSFRCFGLSWYAFLHFRQTSCILISRFVFCHTFLHSICFGIPFWLLGSNDLSLGFFTPLWQPFALPRLWCAVFSTASSSFRGFTRFGAAPRQFILSCAAQFIKPEMEYWKSMRFSHWDFCHCPA